MTVGIGDEAFSNHGGITGGDPDAECFTDGSSLVLEVVQQAGYAVVTLDSGGRGSAFAYWNLYSEG